MPLGANCCFPGARERAEPAVGEALALEVTEAIGFERGCTAFAHPRFFDDEIFDLRQEPGVDVRQLLDALERPACTERIRDIQQAVRARRAQLVSELVALFF